MVRKKVRPKIMLDVGCGTGKQKGWVGMDLRQVDGVDIVHDAETIPWPLEDGECAVVMMSHLMEHICPKRTLVVVDEVWRVLEADGIFLVVSPYATSFGQFQDPTHCGTINEAWVCYFDPTHPSGLWNIYRAKPWKIEKNYWQPNGNIEIVLRKVNGKNDEVD